MFVEGEVILLYIRLLMFNQGDVELQKNDEKLVELEARFKKNIYHIFVMESPPHPKKSVLKLVALEISPL